MSRLDLVIFGATGFTGKKAVEETARVAAKWNITWGVAGRSQKKLEDIVTELSKKTGEDHSSTKIITADVSDEASLKAMCAQARVLVNCCGPYRHYGEPVVKAAIDSKTHYVDVSGEPQFIETMQLEYDKAARDAGVYVISACGFDSIPNDMGVVYMQQQFEGTLNSVESYLSMNVLPELRDEASKTGLINYGTWESLVYSLSSFGELPALRKKIYPQRLPTFKPKLQPRSTIHKRDGRYCLPFLGSDGSVVYRTQRHLYENMHKRPVQFKPYVKLPSLTATILSVITAVVLYVMGMTSFTRNLLLNHPRFFSFGMITREGPKEHVMNGTVFKMMLHGEGWPKGVDVDAQPPSKNMVIKVSGVNPGYGATVTALVFSAITVLKEKDKMPSEGGVYTTGVAFYNTDLIKNLNENNLKFSVVEN